MVRIHPDPPTFENARGAIVQLGERLLCKQEVTGSIPVGSTSTQQLEEATIKRACALDWCFFKTPIGCSLTIWDRR
jgi:hypothetical protein